MAEEREHARLVAWHDQMEQAHARLRRALEVTRQALAAGDEVPAAERDLLLYCHGFCVALDGHHRAEDAALFPALLDRRPELADVVRALAQDHSMIGHLLHALRAALDDGRPGAELARHLDGIGAIMESHFRYEERQLLGVLAGLELALDVPEALGPL
ncbi:hemerythrin domain-containing protein [Nocardioides sp. L-11A]|uniref:hemerythrin domain-containing protein n=1 Tax=Nocardioides sp. L-11A TaxID=3043848 RepID=UPI00249BC8E0|nr:hemerythrin domain-containing protein [Nocardioides sp. L-11A]